MENVPLPVPVAVSPLLSVIVHEPLADTLPVILVLPPLHILVFTLVMLAVGRVFTVTEADVALTHLPLAEAVAVITSFADTALTVADHVPPLTVAVPIWFVPPLNTVIVVPLASVLVPLIVVAPAHIGDVMMGAAVAVFCAVIVYVLPPLVLAGQLLPDFIDTL
jgi:hypothetical protein